MLDKTIKKNFDSKKDFDLKDLLKAGEQSGLVNNFDRDKFIKALHDKYISDKSDAS